MTNMGQTWTSTILLNFMGVYDYPLTNTSPFSNVRTNHYWSATEVATIPTSAWFFHFNSGTQSHISKGTGKFAWAVQSGNVGAVPIPAAVWLFGSGLLGLIGVARRKKA